MRLFVRENRMTIATQLSATLGAHSETNRPHCAAKRAMCATRNPAVAKRTTLASRNARLALTLVCLLGIATCAYAQPLSEQRTSDTRDTLRFVDGLLDGQAPSLPAGQIPHANDIAPGEQAWLDALKAKQQGMGQPPAADTPEAHYFVSFSMPDEVLAPLVAQASTYGIAAHLRGMVNGDMRQTANAVLRLVKDRQQGGLAIDPTAFRRYGITAVPALVLTCKEGSDRIAGNLSLDAALTKIAEAGTCQENAKRLLAQHTDTGATP